MPSQADHFPTQLRLVDPRQGVYFHYYENVGSRVMMHDGDTGEIIKTSPLLNDAYETGVSPRYVNREAGRIWAADNKRGGMINGTTIGLLGWASIDDQFTETAWTLRRLTGSLDADNLCEILAVVPVGDFIYGLVTRRTTFPRVDTFVIKGKIDGTGQYSVGRAVYVYDSSGNDSESEAECPVGFGKYLLFTQEGRYITAYDTETDTFKQLMVAPEDRATAGTTDVDMAFCAGRAQDGSIWGYGIDEYGRIGSGSVDTAGFFRCTVDDPVAVRIGPLFADEYGAYTGAGMVDEPYFRVAVPRGPRDFRLRLHRVHMDTLVVELDVGVLQVPPGATFSVGQSGVAAAEVIRAIPGDGPYQPPIAAKPSGNAGEVAFE